MLKKPVTYTDFNGKTITENFYFNLTSAELVQLEMSTMMLSEDMETTTGGLMAYIQSAIDSRSGKRIIEVFNLLIDASYGVRSEDGRLFRKEGVLADFKASAAYGAFFMELVTDAGAGSQFINGIMPAELVASAEKLKQDQIQDTPLPLSEEDFGVKGQTPSVAILDESSEIPAPTKDTGVRTKKEPRSKQELLQAFREKNAPKEPNWLAMTEAEAMALPEEDFYKWLNAQPAAEKA